MPTVAAQPDAHPEPAAARASVMHSATGAPPAIAHALSFDIEDWFHMVEIKAVENTGTWPELSRTSSLVERYTDLILQICERHNTRATFFILGWIAERHPALIKRIATAGHELATHSFWHRKVYELSPESFARDINDSLAAIRAAAGESTPIHGFRAPSFSITKGSEWAFDTLLDCGLTYDASLFPASRGHGGYPCPFGPHIITAPSGRTLPELPMSVGTILGRRFCYSGGGYLRLLPSALIERMLRDEQRAGRGTVVYLHPRDFAPDCPRVPMPLHRRFKCYIGASTTQAKLERLLKAHQWTTCREALRLALPAIASTSGGAS